ncbi:uncharacterized protein LOC135081781 [Ostrinia nubilalis]|uniref:uncharacterized protein LOC114357086 n=1 Tax=Ostrinia furnacalis TaxID=93504 RepID=UPI00103F3835|nr:uncharacterized protein LOC114357086 [Ostrinia furnacalis]
MGFRSVWILYLWALCLIAISVNSLELRRMPLRKVCCTNANTRSVPAEQRQPSLIDLLHIANENFKTSSLQQMERDPFTVASKFGLTPPPIAQSDDSLKKLESQKAYLCSKMSCAPQYISGPVCACNFNTGKVVSFKNRCDMKKHNCRFGTAFKAILEEICPWEFESRRREKTYDYNESKYFN